MAMMNNSHSGGGLRRSISSADLNTTDRCRQYVERDWKQDAPLGGTNYFAVTPSFTLTLPALVAYPVEFRDFLYRRIIDYDMKEDLETANVLNWCKEATTFLPLSTIGDGNCLMHAASLGMWGFHDKNYTLRKAVYEAVMNCRETSLYQRWRLWQEKEIQLVGFKLDQSQWAREWDMVSKQVSLQQTSHGMLESTDQFHVFVLANVLRRPIIMYAKPKMTSYNTGGTLQQVDFHGIYLPLLWDSPYCKKDPLPIAFSSNHYAPLVIIDTTAEYKGESLVLPLIDFIGNELPVRFLLEGENPHFLKQRYLDLTTLPPSYSSPYHISRGVLAARLQPTETPAYLKPLLEGFIGKCFEAYTQQNGSRHQTAHATPPMARSGPPQQSTEAVRKECPGCYKMYGDPMFGGYCSQCARSHKPELSRGSNSSGGSSGSLKCSSCGSNTGQPQCLGMCETCYQGRQRNSGYIGSSSHNQTAAQPRTPPMNHPVPKPRSRTSAQPSKSSSSANDVRQCRTPKCEFWGPAENGFYCSKCYNERKAMGALSPPAGSQEMVISGSSAPGNMLNNEGGGGGGGGGGSEPPKCMECRQFFGSEEYGWLCHGCFMEKTKEDTNVKNKPSPLNNSTPPPVQRSSSYANGGGRWSEGGGGAEDRYGGTAGGVRNDGGRYGEGEGGYGGGARRGSDAGRGGGGGARRGSDSGGGGGGGGARRGSDSGGGGGGGTRRGSDAEWGGRSKPNDWRREQERRDDWRGGREAASEAGYHGAADRRQSYPAHTQSVPRAQTYQGQRDFTGSFCSHQRCFLCDPTIPIDDSELFFICRRHAKNAREMSCPPTSYRQERPDDHRVMATHAEERPISPPPPVAARGWGDPSRPSDTHRPPPGGAAYDGRSSQGAQPFHTPSASSGAEGGGGGDKALPKRLCNTPGCSFYAQPQLNYYCQNCYATDKRR